MPKLEEEALLKLFQPEGRFYQLLPGYELRPQQLEMVKTVAEAFNHEKISLIEAGTGTGKSFAYLLPAILYALLNKERVVISTHTINLQEQLIHKDIPQIKKILGTDFKAVLVKGMGNYLCRRKLKDSEVEISLGTLQEKEQLLHIAGWAEKTLVGSLSELPFSPKRDVWEKVNAEGDTCSYRKCPYFKECGLMIARQEAEEAQVLVVNHHLLFVDIARRQEDPEKGILPSYHHVIVDEAHHLEDIATHFFSKQISRIELLKTMARLASEKSGESGGRLGVLKKLASDFQKKNPSVEIERFLQRFTLELPHARKEVLTKLAEAFDLLTEFSHRLSMTAEEIQPGERKIRIRPHHLQDAYWEQNIREAVRSFVSASKEFIRHVRALEQEVRHLENEKFFERVQGVLMELTAYAERLESGSITLEYFVETALDETHVRWIESRLVTTLENLQLVDASLSIAEPLVQAFFKPLKTIVLCSATLTTQSNFSFIRERLGLNYEEVGKRVQESIFDSPFNYKDQALVVIPKDMPLPHERHFLEEACNRILEAVQASRGNAFVLFTSYTMLKECYKRLEEPLKNLRFFLFKQGDQQRQSLLSAFKSTDRSVLFGTDSFWEGVDVIGEALRSVILVKLPFRVPTEPLTEARTEELLSKGKDPFIDYSLPIAIVKFKQGVGRLIRHHQDRGVIVILDPRIIKKGYGASFLKSLPSCRQIITEGKDFSKCMEQFYRQTHYLVR